MRILLIEPPARTSNEYDVWSQIPGSHLTVLSDREGWGADRDIAVPVRRLPFLGRQEAWTAALAWLRGLGKVDFGAVDLVVSLELFSVGSLQAQRLAKRLDVPHIVWIAETMPDNPIYRLPPYSSITRRIIRGADGFICCTARARDAALSLGCEVHRTRVVHFGLDTKDFHPAATGRASAPVVLFVGMLRSNSGADKGVMDVVDACRRVAQEIDGLRLVLVGDGHLRSELEELSTSEDFLEVRGQMDRSEIPGVMREARVLTLASRRTRKWEEQFGFVLVEAMATGLPVVATRSGAIPEVVAPGNSLCEVGDVAGLAEGIRCALGPAGDRIGSSNRDFCVQRYDATSQGMLLSETIVDLIGKPSAMTGGHR